MMVFKRRSSLRAGGPSRLSLAADLLEEAAATRVPVIDEVRALPAPNWRLHVEAKYENLAEEQRHLFKGEGETQARLASAEAEALRKAAEAQDVRAGEQQKLLAASEPHVELARRVLRPLVVRPPDDRRRYHLTIWGLLAGDVAGISGAAIALGEIVWLAVAQAVSVAVAMIAVGCIAAEMRRSREARKRQRDDLTDDERVFAPLFTGEDPGERIARYVVFGALGSVALVGGGIFALRSVTDGLLGGVVFGLLATAIALGSWANSYTHADEVADKLEAYEVSFRNDLKQHQRQASGGPREEQARQAEIAQTIRAEHAALGEAAYRRVRAAGFEALVANPAVAGHGRLAAKTSAPGSDDSAALGKEPDAEVRLDGDRDVAMKRTQLSQVEPSGDGSMPPAGS